MDPNHLNPDPAQTPPADDHLLEDLASFTGMFNPERIWQEEVELDELKEQDTQGVVEPESSAGGGSNLG